MISIQLHIFSAEINHMALTMVKLQPGNLKGDLNLEVELNTEGTASF